MSLVNELLSPEERSRLRQVIDRYAQGSPDLKAFFEAVLPEVLGVVNSRCGAVFIADSSDQLIMTAGVNFEAIGFGRDGFADERNRNSALLRETYTGAEPVAIDPDEDTSLERLLPVPVLFSPIIFAESPVGVAEVVVPGDGQHQERLELLTELMQIAGDAWVRKDDPLSEPDAKLPAEFWQEVEEFSLRAQRSLDVKEVACVIVHGINRVLGSDGVSLCIRRGKKTIFLDDSNTLEKSNSRANLISAIRKLAGAVIDQKELMAFPVAGQKLPTQVETTLHKFVEESQSQRVLAIPLFPLDPLVRPEDTKKEPEILKAPERPDAKACLLIEYGRMNDVGPHFRQRAEALASHAEASLFNAERHQKLPLRPVWRLLGEGVDWLKGRGLVLMLCLLGLIVGTITAAMLIPVPYHVNAEGQLFPVDQYRIFAPWDGRVENVLVEGGQRVEAGDPLVVLFNDELKSQILATNNKIREQQALIETLTARREQARRQNEYDQLADFQGQIDSAEIQIAGLEAQLDIYKSRDERKTVTAPVSGVVTTFQPKQTLRNRSVSRGEMLVQIMDDSQKWRLELQVEERRMGHILEAIDDGEIDLETEFRLATDPETWYDATLTKIATRPGVDEEKGSIVEVHALVASEDEIEDRRIGAEVRASIWTGRSSLAYYLLGDFWNWLRLRFWL